MPKKSCTNPTYFCESVEAAGRVHVTGRYCFLDWLFLCRHLCVANLWHVCDPNIWSWIWITKYVLFELVAIQNPKAHGGPVIECRSAWRCQFWCYVGPSWLFQGLLQRPLMCDQAHARNKVRRGQWSCLSNSIGALNKRMWFAEIGVEFVARRWPVMLSIFVQQGSTVGTSSGILPPSHECVSWRSSPDFRCNVFMLGPSEDCSWIVRKLFSIRDFVALRKICVVKEDLGTLASRRNEKVCDLASLRSV